MPQKKKNVMLGDKKTISKADAKAVNLTIVQKRAIDSAFTMEAEKSTPKEAIFQHSIFCHTFFPYRNPGNVISWEQEQGKIKLAIQSLKTLNRVTDTLEYAGIPYGTKSRLILMYMNTSAIQNQSQTIDVGKTMSEFIRELGLTIQINSIREVKEQIRRIQASNITLAYCDGEHSVETRLQIIRKFENWFQKDERQRVLWDSAIELSNDYFESLMQHAVPLDRRAIAALSHNAMAMDIYAWLGQRLHRIKPDKPQFVSWQNIKDQFGQGYEKMNDFKKAFRKSLTLAKTQYMDAKFNEAINKGFWLENSPTPVPVKTMLILPTK